MTENKRFIVKEDSFTDKLTKKTYYELSDIIDLCNNLWEQTQRFEKHNQRLMEENEYYKSIFFELVETALTDKNCRELYCKGILDIFDKANSLNQARDMIKEHLE